MSLVIVVRWVCKVWQSRTCHCVSVEIFGIIQVRIRIWNSGKESEHRFYFSHCHKKVNVNIVLLQHMIHRTLIFTYRFLCVVYIHNIFRRIKAYVGQTFTTTHIYRIDRDEKTSYVRHYVVYTCYASCICVSICWIAIYTDIKKTQS